MRNPDNCFEWHFEFDNDPESANVHLCLPAETLPRMDAAMEILSIRSREDFAISAVLWALRNLEEAAAILEMGLEE